MRRYSSPAVTLVLARIAEAALLVERAEAALRRADPETGDLRAAAQRAHYTILEGICALTDSDADLVEPALTRFETHLFRVFPLLAGCNVRGLSS